MTILYCLLNIVFLTPIIKVFFAKWYWALNLWIVILLLLYLFVFWLICYIFFPKKTSSNKEKYNSIFIAFILQLIFCWAFFYFFWLNIYFKLDENKKYLLKQCWFNDKQIISILEKDKHNKYDWQFLFDYCVIKIDEYRTSLNIKYKSKYKEIWFNNEERYKIFNKFKTLDEQFLQDTFKNHNNMDLNILRHNLTKNEYIDIQRFLHINNMEN